MAPHIIRVNDSTAIFAGGRLPMVLRRESEKDYFKLITPAYLHGIMGGEAWQENDTRHRGFVIV